MLGNAVGTGFLLSYDQSRAGWFVTDVWPTSPAEKAGIKVGDEVFVIHDLTLQAPDRMKLSESEDGSVRPRTIVQQALRQAGVGAEVRYRVRRDGQDLDFTIPLRLLQDIHEEASTKAKVLIPCCWIWTCGGCVPEGRDPKDCGNECTTG